MKVRKRIRRARRSLARGVRRLPGSPPLARQLDRVAGRIERVSRPVDFELTGDSFPVAYRELAAARLAQPVSVKQPLVLVSQAHRSGGTLLMRLFDGHPSLHAVPHELGPLLPSKALPRDVDGAWRALYDTKLSHHFLVGLRQAENKLNRDRERLQFVLPPALHRRIFEVTLAAQPPATERVVLDAYLTAYFNAWLDNPSVERNDVRWVTGFEPQAIAQRRFGRFRENYPDGRCVTVIREPAAWFASARPWNVRFERLDRAIEYWRASVRSALELVRSEPDAILVLDFDALVRDTEQTMRDVAGFLGIGFDDVLTRPTMNGMPVRANSSFPSAEYGVLAEPAERADVLTLDERGRVNKLVGDLYREALAAIESGRAERQDVGHRAGPK